MDAYMQLSRNLLDHLKDHQQHFEFAVSFHCAHLTDSYFCPMILYARD
jgi:hypothetical protein